MAGFGTVSLGRSVGSSNFGGPIDWNALAERKYNNIEAQTAVARTGANASMIGAQADAARVPSQNRLADAQGNFYGVQAEQMPLNDAVNRRRTEADTLYTDQQTGVLRDQRGPLTYDQTMYLGMKEGLPYQPRALSSGMSSPFSDERILDSVSRLGFSRGTARVPGRGDPRVDSVPAALAPGEAVLNTAAADKMGRGLIAALNSMGARKMGLV